MVSYTTQMDTALPNELLTDHPRISRAGYRLPVKANPLDCGLITSGAEPIQRPIHGEEAACSYRILMNFAMEDVKRILGATPPSKQLSNEEKAYQKFLAQLLNSKKTAFEIELAATVNGVPVDFLELTGSKSSSMGPHEKLPEDLKNTCIGQYGAHNLWNTLHFYPDRHKEDPKLSGEIFQRIVTNRRSGRVVAFSDDIMHTRVEGANQNLGRYESVFDMEAKQDCDGFTGHIGKNAKYIGPAKQSVSIQILENNRIIGRDRVFEFEARPLDVIEFHVRLKPAKRSFQTISKAGDRFELNGKFSVLDIEAQIPQPLPPGEYLISRSPSQIIPPNLDPVYCGMTVTAPQLANTCRPWTRVAWAELLLGAEYRTYSDAHRTVDNKNFSLKRRREILRLHPEIEVDSNHHRLEWRENVAPLASDQYINPKPAYLIEGLETPLMAGAIAAQVIADTAQTPRISFLDLRTPNVAKVADGWTLWAQRALSDGSLAGSPTFETLRFADRFIAEPAQDPKQRFEQAEDACLDGNNAQFDECEQDVRADGEKVLNLEDIEVIPLEHRFRGPVHETQAVFEQNQLIADTDICTIPLPDKYVSCWRGQDDTVFLHDKISSKISRDFVSGEHQRSIDAQSVSAMIGLEQPLIEEFLFELDAMGRVACNEPEEAPYCSTLSASPEKSDAAKFAEASVSADDIPPVAEDDHRPEVEIETASLPAVSGSLVRAPPQVPNRPNPPEESMALHVVGPIQSSFTRSVSANAGANLGGLSFNTNQVQNSNITRSFFIDLNGDGFPETVSTDPKKIDGFAKLTSPVGLLREEWWHYFKDPSHSGDLVTGLLANGYIQKSQTRSEGKGFGLSPSSFAQINQKTIDAVVSPGFDLSFAGGFETDFHDFRDLNGDGLVDVVAGTTIKAGLNVAYNIGSALQPPTGSLKVQDGNLSGYTLANYYKTTNSAGFGVRLGFDINSGSFVGGMGLGSRIEGSEGALMDFTGDGRADVVVPASAGGKSYLAVFPNLGNGFERARLHEIAGWEGSESSVSETTLADSGAAFTGGINALFVKVVFNPGVKRASNQTRELVHVRDVNGDGVPDLARVSGLFKNAVNNGDERGRPHLGLPDQIETHVNYNPDATYHLLSRIISPTRSIQEISYKLQGNTGPELGRPIWAVDRVSVFDGFDADSSDPGLYSDGHDVRLDVYTYSDGYFNRAEKSFYGFSEVEKKTLGCSGSHLTDCPGAAQIAAGSSDDNYVDLQRTLRHFHNRDILTKGRLKAEVVLGVKSTSIASESSGEALQIETEPGFELVSASRTGHSINDLETLEISGTQLCEMPTQTNQANWKHKDFKEDSELGSRWRSATRIDTNGRNVLGDNSICGDDLQNCSNQLDELVCEAGYWLEQKQFWAQQTGSVRERFVDLYVSSPGNEVGDGAKTTTLIVDDDTTLYSAFGIDHDQWGQQLRSYSLGDVDNTVAPIPASSFHTTTTYADRQGLSHDTPGAEGAYPILNLVTAEQLFAGPWPSGKDAPIRMREALYSGSLGGGSGSAANTVDICEYPVSPNEPDFRFREGICAEFKESIRNSLSDGLSSLKDAQRAAYEIDGLPSGTDDFNAIIHTKFPDYDLFGNLIGSISPLTNDREWIERRFDYSQDPFLIQPTRIELARCVQETAGIGASSEDVVVAEERCGFGVGYKSKTDARESIVHSLEQRVDPHHGMIAGSKDPNQNRVLIDYDRWGRFRLLARNWGAAPRHNQTFMTDLQLASKKAPFGEGAESWRVLGVANYGWPTDDTQVLSSYIRQFASSNAYRGASGVFDTTRHSSVFADGLAKTVQSVVEAEVCKNVGESLLNSRNFEISDNLEARCESIMAGRVTPAPASDVLVGCFNHKLPTLDGIDDAVGIGGPDERLWVLIGLGDEAFDRCLEIDDRMEHTALEASCGEFGKEAFDSVQPGARCRHEVEGPAGVTRQPFPHFGMFVRGVVVEDHVDDLAGWHLRLDGVEKANELLMPMALHTATDHRAVEDVERGEQCGGAVAFVVMGERSTSSPLHGQPRLGAIERLDLRFLVDRKHDGMSGRVDIETDDISELAGKVDIIGELEGPKPMGRQPVCFPDPMYARRTDADGIGHHPNGPVGRLTRWLRHGEIQHALHGISGHRRFAGRPGLVAQEPIHTLMHEAFLPAPHIGLGKPRTADDLVRAEAVRGRQNDLGASDVLLSAIAVTNDPLKTTAIVRRNGDADPCSHPGTICQSPSNGNPMIETIH